MAVALTVTVNGYDYGFDYEDERLDVDSTLDTIEVEYVYEAIKEAQAHVTGIVYPKIAHAEGKTDLGGGDQTFLTVILLNNWALNSLKSSGGVTIKGGNLVRSDGAWVVRENPLITYFSQTSQAGVLFETGTSGLTAAESTKLSTIDTVVAAIQSTMLTLSRWKSLFFNRSNTINANRKITSFVAGDATEEQVTVNVDYDENGVPETETISS